MYPLDIHHLNRIIALSLTAVMSCLIGIFVFFKAPRKTINRVFAAYFLAIATWSAGDVSLTFAMTHQTALFIVRAAFLGIVTIPLFYLHFVVLLLGLKRPWAIRIAYTVAFIFLFLIPYPWFVKGASPKSGLPYFTDAGPLFPLFLAYFFILVVYGTYQLIKAYRNAIGDQRGQLKYLLAGTLLGYLGGSPGFLYVFDRIIFPINP